MIRAVFLICLSVCVILVTSNPVGQVTATQQCAICQQTPYINPNSTPTGYQQPPSQTNPYSQQATVQNVANNGNLDFNQVLLNKIMGNQCLQKIFNPNTKLYNQNGQEVQRNPNTATPNVVNNYFILPPELFYTNASNPREDTRRNVARKRKPKGRRRGNRYKKKTNVVNGNVLINHESKNKTSNAGRVKNADKKQNRKKGSVKTVEKSVTIEEKNDNDEVIETATIKTRKKGARNKNKEVQSTTSASIENSEKVKEQEIIDTTRDQKKKKRKQRGKSKTQATDKEPLTKILTENYASLETEVKLSSVKKKATPSPIEKPPPKLKEKVKDNTESLTSSEIKPQLKNIELPVDNRETIKDITETRSTRNSKSDKGKKESKQSLTPIPDDILQSFFPYMYLNNYFYPNGNYPFNFEQIYKPNFSRSINRSRKRKNRKNKDEQNTGKDLPNVVEVKLKPKKQNVNTENPVDTEKSIEDIETQINPMSEEITAQMAEPVTDIPMEVPHKVSPIQSEEETPETEDTGAKEELEKPETLETESVETNAKMQMPFTEIEDLHEYITPDLGSEDIVPIVYTNGIINDYYPIFFDDPFYSSDKSYHLKDIENERLFYTTDRGHEEKFSRDRRKYDPDYRIPNDIKDRINFRRGFINKERDKTKDIDVEENSIQRPFTHEKMVKPEFVPAKVQIKEIRFQTPPSLENPDFKTRKIETEFSKPDVYDEPVYDDDKFSDKLSTKLPDFSPFDEDMKEVSLPNAKKNIDHNHDHVETVFAKTRVVKYGVPKEESEENTPYTPVHDEISSFLGDDHTTYVIAKSLGSVDDIYW